jgi:hypothetical protein
MRVNGVVPWVSLALLCGTIGAGCYSDSPLDPTAQVARDPNLLGAWKCVTADPEGAEAGTATFAAAADREYRLTWQEGDKKPDSYRAFISLVGDSTFLNIRPLEESKHNGWAFFRYSFPRTRVLYAEMVRDDPFENKEASASAKAARATLEKALGSTPDTMQDFCVCIRPEAPKAEENRGAVPH